MTSTEGMDVQRVAVTWGQDDGLMVTLTLEVRAPDHAMFPKGLGSAISDLSRDHANAISVALEELAAER